MESITIGQIVGAIGIISVIGTFAFKLYNLIKKSFLDKIKKNTNDIERIQKEVEDIKKEIQDGKEERFILLKGQLACLKGLKEQGCNGQVTQAIKDIEDYLLQKSHE